VIIHFIAICKMVNHHSLCVVTLSVHNYGLEYSGLYMYYNLFFYQVLVFQCCFFVSRISKFFIYKLK